MERQHSCAFGQNAVLVQTLLYGSETWLLQKKNERKMTAVEIRSLSRICGVSLADRIRNEEIHRMAGTSKDVTIKMKKNVLSLFEHVERMGDERMAKKIMMEKWVVRDVGGDLG